MTQPSQRLVTYALLAILGLALVLRIWGITFGLPYDFTADEVHEIVRALKLGAGEYSWASGKGGLYYLLFIEYGFLFLAWWLTGRVDGPTDFALLYVQDPTAFYLAGRLTVAFMGTLTCLMVFSIGKRIYDWRVGLGSAFIGATAYYHAMWSHYINVDTGMTLAMWGSILAYVIYESDLRLRWLILAGVLAGVSVAFKLPGLVTLPVLLLAIATQRRRWPVRQSWKVASTVTLAMVLTIGVISPENLVRIGSLANNFSSLFVAHALADTVVEVEWDDIYSVTIMREGSYFAVLLRNHNVVLTVSVLLGAALGCWQRNRWDIIWSVFIVVFLSVMVLADRPGIERYLFPILPAFWLLGARAMMSVFGKQRLLSVVALSVIVILPLYALIQQNYTWTRPDTRVLAKEWIEENVPSGAKLLMDGMQYRFIHSPPLNPDEVSVSRRVEDAKGADGRISRGVSARTLDLYAEAMAKVSGPKYDLHSTVYGLGVDDLSYYLQACFDYIVTSEAIAKRYAAGTYADRYPLTATFYRELPRDRRFQKVYSVEPEPWKVQGPAITVYKVRQSCG